MLITLDDVRNITTTSSHDSSCPKCGYPSGTKGVYTAGQECSDCHYMDDAVYSGILCFRFIVKELKEATKVPGTVEITPEALLHLLDVITSTGGGWKYGKEPKISTNDLFHKTLTKMRAAENLRKASK